MKSARQKSEKVVMKSAIWEDDEEKDTHELPPVSFWEELMTLDENEDQWVTPVLHS